MRITAAADLGVATLLGIAGGDRVELSAGLITQVSANRAAALRVLSSGQRVYGVNTGMGAASEIDLDQVAQAQQQENLMRGRAVGGPPWLDRREARAVLAFRLRSFLLPDAAVSAPLCERLGAMLNDGEIPQIPRTGSGAAGEIIPLAHLGAAVAEGFRLGPKEGVALLEGVPVTSALAALLAAEVRQLRQRYVAITAAGLVLVGANTDPYRAEVARADPQLAAVLAAVRDLIGVSRAAATLQAPVSFRVAGPALAHLDRLLEGLDAAVVRAIEGVTDSPAFLDGRFVGTAGFDGIDLAAHLDALRAGVIRLAEISTARLHRLLDDRITGLPRQLSARPGLHAGMVTVHKRAAGIGHALPRQPSGLGPIETSLGQEDVQSFSLQAAEDARIAAGGLRDVLACELLGLVQLNRLEDRLREAPAPLRAFLTAAGSILPAGTQDRPFGPDITALARWLSFSGRGAPGRE